MFEIERSLSASVTKMGYMLLQMAMNPQAIAQPALPACP